jgi:aryl-alcohol dehydrogenase-like predicted oxidoreductase
LSSTAVTAADRQDPHELARGLFKQLIEIKTTESGLGSTPAAEAMAQRLREGGFDDVQVVGPGGRKQNMVARLKGNGRKRPVLLIGHLDVVEARREEWTVDPFVFLEQDGYFYGRGTQDMKDGVAIMVTTLLRYRSEGYRPDRDIILALTADEEGGTANGVDWLLKNRRDLVDAEFVLNHDGGGVTAENGRAVQVDLTASEKVYADFDLTVTNPGGHSSAPPRENAIYSLARALDKISAHDFAFELNNVTREYFERGVMTPDDVVGGGHCLAPGYLASQIERSRVNLGLDAIDVYYVHNPEQQLDAVSIEELFARLGKAFELLEERCGRGEIGVYGCATWNGFRSSSDSRGHLELAELVELAHEVAGDAHHFRVVQLPVNLAFTEAVRAPTQTVKGRSMTLLEAAAALDVSVVASASLLQGKLAANLPAQLHDAIPGHATDAQRAIAFVRSLPVISAGLVGMKQIQHLEENLGAAAV